MDDIDISDSELPLLPAGWTYQRLMGPDGGLIRDLPEEDCDLIINYCSERTRLVQERRVAKGELEPKPVNPHVAEQETRIAREYGLATLDGDVGDLARALDYTGAACWGFVVFRTWGYAADEKYEWKKYWEKWHQYCRDKLHELGAGDADSDGDFASRLKFILIEDNDLAGKPPEYIKDQFQRMLDDDGEKYETIPHGIDRDLCLMVDEGCVRSFMGAKTKPFVIGVYTTIDDQGMEQEEVMMEGEEPDPVYFKIAFGEIVTELWQKLQRQPPEELIPGPGKLYKGIPGFDTDEDE